MSGEAQSEFLIRDGFCLRKVVARSLGRLGQFAISLTVIKKAVWAKN